MSTPNHPVEKSSSASETDPNLTDQTQSTDTGRADFLRDAAPQTRAIHAGTAPDAETGAVLTPVYQSTTFLQDGVGRDRGYTYTRSGNPTVSALEARLGELENSLPACAFATGMAATTTLFLATLRAGDQVILSDVVYGGTTRLLQQVLDSFDIQADFVDTSDLDKLARALSNPTESGHAGDGNAEPKQAAAAKERPVRLVFLETPANPTLKLTDIKAAAKLAKAAGALVAVDNTFLTAVLQQPLDLGADVVVYSTTKYIEGHNSTVGGALLTRDEKLAERIRFVKNTAGTTQAPWESWLTLRGITTLPLRLDQHSANALKVAQFLEQQPEISRVYYPFLESFPQYALAKRQQLNGGGMLSFELHGGIEAGIRFMESVQLCTLAENLGAVESLITHPASMTHGTVPRQQRIDAGITDGLVRLSVGLEAVEDQIRDLGQALRAAVSGGKP
jgi:cystathionine beta-lyase/cystathionine gamma-synthase